MKTPKFIFQLLIFTLSVGVFSVCSLDLLLLGFFNNKEPFYVIDVILMIISIYSGVSAIYDNVAMHKVDDRDDYIKELEKCLNMFLKEFKDVEKSTPIAYYKVVNKAKELLNIKD